ncbi:MAG: SpoIID/LytB domain-containing protein [Calditrichaceae bacterium]|nr:SpoIID/LytB domain-containing protein [Calditrichaceae bacterium]
MIRLNIFILMALILLAGCIPQIKEAALTPAPKIRVLLDSITKKDSIIFNNVYALKAEEADYEFGKNNRRIYIEPLEPGYRIYNENRIFKFTVNDGVIFKSKDDEGFFTFHGKRYKGDILISLIANKDLQIINRIDLEKYLESVVPAEMPSHKTGYYEALKSQAICARTYAVKKMDERRDRSFDVYDDHRDQVYGGLKAQTTLASNAVKETRGDVMMFDNKLADVFYHSTSGGILESAENVWPNYNQPYLKSRQDAIGQSFADENSPYFRWSDTLSINELDVIFNHQFNKSYLNQIVQDTTELIFEVHILKRTSSGRVAEMQVSFGDTTINLQGYEIRNFFAKPQRRSLPSTLFTIKSISDSLLVINGGGFGHGVGMSQYGALNMSEKGFKYYDILVNKYFIGTYLKKVY